jgi:hypothetical protein
MKALIINYNRLTLPVKMAFWLFNHGIEPIIIDNHSDYKPLLDYYSYRCRFKVISMDKNYGYKVIWSQNLLNELGIEDLFIISDPDLDLSGIPDDFLSVLEAGLNKYPQFDKCGFSLEINDVKHENTVNWENKFWRYPLDDLYFNAPVDTTFALYKTKEFSYNALRTNRPYTARHVPWYYEDLVSMPEDEQYYYKTMDEETKAHRTEVI